MMPFCLNGHLCLKIYSLKTAACVIKDMGQLPYEEKLNMLRLLDENEGMLKVGDGPGLIINIRNSLKELLG